VLGPDDPKTLITRNNLASMQGGAGDAAGAAAEFEALVADRLRVLGPDHPDTLAARGTMPTEAATRAEGKRPVRLSLWRALWHTKR
jgi:hypothetical protein